MFHARNDLPFVKDPSDREAGFAEQVVLMRLHTKYYKVASFSRGTRAKSLQMMTS